MRAIEQDRDGALWIGTRGGGLSRFKDGTFTVYTEKDGLASDSVQGLFMDRDATLWIATRQGLNRFKDGTVHDLHGRTTGCIPASSTASSRTTSAMSG